MHRRVIFTALVAMFAMACGAGAQLAGESSGADSGAAPTSPPSSPAEAPPTQPENAPPSSGLDVSSYIACEIVTAQDVADLVGGPIYRELEQQPGPGCIYEVQAGPDGYAQFIVYIQPTALIEVMIETLPEELGQPVAGLGDAAYLDYDEAAETYDLSVLVRNRFGLEIIGENEEWVRGIGELFVSRLVAP
jgi:hypothetical protein